MKFSPPLIHGKLIKRYKRFLADVILDDGTIVTAHCTNTGSMKSCIEENADVYLSISQNLKRKTKYTWEMININTSWVGINTSVPNKIIFKALQNDTIELLSGLKNIRKEVVWGNSRLDLYGEENSIPCFIEVKNVTYRNENKALFPDAVTIRGQKHLDTLIQIKKTGARAVMVYVIQRTDIDLFGPATAIDPIYSKKLNEAHNQGVEIIPVMLQVSPDGIKIKELVSFEL